MQTKHRRLKAGQGRITEDSRRAWLKFNEARRPAFGIKAATERFAATNAANNH